MRERGWGRAILIVSNTFHAGIGKMADYVASRGRLFGSLRSLADPGGGSGRPRTMNQAVGAGIAYVPAERRRPGLRLNSSVSENVRR